MDNFEYKNGPTGRIVTAADPESGIIEAFVSVTGLVDNVNDIIEPGAYEKTLAVRTPKGCWSHDWSVTIAKALDVKELMPGDPDLPKTLANGEPWPAEAGALYVKMQFNTKTTRGREAYDDIIFFGDQQEFSIGYSVPVGGATVDKKTGIRHIKTLDLFEFSPVLWGAASQARTKKDALAAVKSMFQTDMDFLNELKEIDPSIELHITEFTEEKTVEEEVEEKMSEQILGKVPEDENVDAAAQADAVEEVTEVVQEVVEESGSAPLDSAVITALRGLQEVLVRVLNASQPSEESQEEKSPVVELIAEEKTDKAKDEVEKSTIRTIMDELIFKSDLDINRLDTIDNNMRLFEASVKTGNADDGVRSADAAIDEIGFILDTATNPDDQEKLKELAAAIADALNTLGAAQKTSTEEVLVVEVPVVEEAVVEPDVTMTREDIKALMELTW